MYKLILTCSLLTIITLNGSPRMYQEEQQRAETRQDLTLIKRISPANTVMALDLHEVLFKREASKIAKHVLVSLVRGLFLHSINPWFWYKVRQVWNSKDGGMIAEDFYRRLCVQYPRIKAYEDDFMNVSIECEPIESMVRLVRQLKEQGYYLVVLSNIGSETYERHKQKFPEVMNLFDAVFTPCPEENYLCKPEREFYEHFKTFLQDKGQGHKQIFFIDDLAENIQGAEEAGIIGLRCHSPEQVIRFFEQHKIIIDAESSKRSAEENAIEDLVLSSDNGVLEKSSKEQPVTLSTSDDPTFEYLEPKVQPGQEENMR